MLTVEAARLLTDSLRLDAAPEAAAGRLRAVPADEWGLLLTHADRHSLTPLLGAVWRTGEGWAALPAAAQARLDRAHADNGRRNALIRQELIEITALLENAAVPALVLKGWPLAERLYAGPAERVLYDHDLLVAPERAAAGHAALRAAGFTPLPAKDEWVAKHLPPLWRNDGYRWDGYLFDPLYPRPVELHVRLWEAGWRGLRVRDLDGLWARARTRPVAGRALRVLGDEDTLIHLAMHFAGHLVEREARLNQLLDLARFQAGPPLDWDAVVRGSAQAGVDRFVFAALWLARAIFGAPAPP
ncbi:MAG: nucleotidyltransferase family protein, partial [Anaerolineales bacterium]|nr:nucleotidyltransferase family protein [Anaerolineales bacterium]